jgi:hypothetical protein
MILTVLDVQKEDNKFSCFDMNDAFNVVPIDEDIVYLENIFDKSDKKSDDEKGCHEESDDEDRDSGDDEPLVTVSKSNEDAYDLDLSLSAVANVIADVNFTTGAHIFKSQDIWIADTGATSYVTKHTEGGTKHRQTSVPTCGFAEKQFNLTAKWIFQLLTLTRMEQRSSTLSLEMFKQIRSFITTYSV